MTAQDDFVFRDDCFFQAISFLKQTEKKTDWKPKSPVKVKRFFHTFLEEVKLLYTEKDRLEKRKSSIINQFFAKVRLSKNRKGYQAKGFYRMKW